MERRRKGALLHKAEYQDHHNFQPPVNGNAVCSCSKPSARTYDFQTQTITFDEDPRVGNRMTMNHKVPDSCSPMDQDLEFYPVDDHPTPSTFTAWDAFLAGNQAFFREPPGLMPDPAFSYMDVIPEEDDLEALLESDTDDTGSSVSTVIDRFSRTSTANSSFSERCKGTADLTFDLQKVLSPFERLEKELDGDEPKDDHELYRKKEILKGPIVVITNSSSCEDVHSTEEEEEEVAAKISEKLTEELTKEVSDSETASIFDTNNYSIVHNSIPVAEMNGHNENAISSKSISSDAKPCELKTPPVPARTKLVNGSKTSEKNRLKPEKNESQSSLLSPSSLKSKRSYPTPTVPPRMSKHLPARRTRSDPGSADQPSRIPRPISSSSRSLHNNSALKSTSKSNRTPRASPAKKPKISESPKLSRNVVKTSTSNSEPSDEAIVDELNSTDKNTEEPQEVSDGIVEKSCTDATFPSQDDHFPDETNEISGLSYETTTLNDIESIHPESENADIPALDTDVPSEDNMSEDNTMNPSLKSETNPLKADVEMNVTFVVCDNPCEESQEETPVLQPKGQMSASLIPPPVPERLSLKCVQKHESDNISSEVAPSPDETDPFCNDEQASTPLDANEERLKLDSISESDSNSTDKSLDLPCRANIIETIEYALVDMGIVAEKVETEENEVNVDLAYPGSNSSNNETTLLENNQGADYTVNTDILTEMGQSIEDKTLGPQRPIEDILQALDQLVLSTPREVEINIDWGARGPVNIREKTVLPPDASGDRSDIEETDGLAEDRKRDIETLLKEVDECLKLDKGEDLSSQLTTQDAPLPASDSFLSTTEKTQLSPGSLDAPTVGSTNLNFSHHDEQDTFNTDVLLENSPSAMLKHQSQNILADDQRVPYSTPYQEAFSKPNESLDEDSLLNKQHSSGCDDSGVFLEDPIASSPDTRSRSVADRLQNALDKLSNESPKMRQYSIHEGLDSDAEKSDDLGLASSSIDSADDLDGDPLPSSLQINSCAPVVVSRQKPPPVPARNYISKLTDYQQNNNRYYSNEITSLEVPNLHKPPLSKSSSSGDDSNSTDGGHCTNAINSSVTLSEMTKNMYNQQKNEQSRSNFDITRSYHEDISNQQRDINQESKANFLARTLSSSPSGKKLDVTNVSHSSYTRRNSDQPSNFKWKSEECLRTAAETKWSIPGRRYEKSVSVKDRIAMFSEMEASQNSNKREDLHRYGSENNIKTATATLESKKSEAPLDDNKSVNNLRDSKWHSMHSIAKMPTEKEIPFTTANIKPALSIPSLVSNTLTDPLINYSTLPVKLEVEPPKPIVSCYPETQLTNNKRYNYGLYSLKNLKNTETLLSKKAAGSNLLSIIDIRKQTNQKLKGLVIPDKPHALGNSNKELPTIVSSDSDSLKESLPITKAMSLPRNKKLENPFSQRQNSLTEPPPWKVESNSYNLSKYSPAFKNRNLELPGSSLSPTPPSSITSPMSPTPSSPSSICSSTLQQNVFQFSLSHSKPVQPLQPEKALMSPPSLPSDVEYEGDNSEDSSHSASPMRRSSKELKIANQQSPSNVPYGISNSFTSSVKTISHQPMMVEQLTKSPIPSEQETPKPKAAVYLSKTEIVLKKEEPKPEYLPHNEIIPKQELTHFAKNCDPILPVPDIAVSNSNSNVKNGMYSQTKIEIAETQYYPEMKNGEDTKDSVGTYSVKTNGSVKNGGFLITHSYLATEDHNENIPVGKFRALPVSLQESENKPPIHLETRPKKNYGAPTWTNGRPPHSECDESEDDDSHSTLSHRTEDSRHTTTDDCLSDATTDSFEKPRLLPEPPGLQRTNDDNGSTEGYLSDASTDVSIRRFTNNRVADSNAYSTEEYLSDATAESPDPEWISNRGCADQPFYSRSKNYLTGSSVMSETVSNGFDKGLDLELRPRRLSQQRTVLKAAVEPSGSVQKFKALAEKWEQRSDVTSPPPPLAVSLTNKRDAKPNSLPTSVITTSSASTLVIKGKSTLPPSLMPRNSEKLPSSKSSSRENIFSMRTEKESSSSVDGIVTRKSSSSTSTIIETSNGWSQFLSEDVESTSRRDSVSSSSSSSKTTLKDDEVFDSSTQETSTRDGVIPESSAVDETHPGQRSQMSLQSRQDGIFNNEPRSRRGADFSRNSAVPDWTKHSRPAFGIKSTFSVSDIRRSFENGGKEVEKAPPPPPPKKQPMPAARLTPSPAVTPPPSIFGKPSLSTKKEIAESSREIRMAAETAAEMALLQNERVGDQLEVLTVVLHREAEGGGSVGITLAGGADYEVKEITVHKVISGSIADRDGRVLKGDRVMSINGRDLRGVSHGEALHILKAPSPSVLLVLARDKSGKASPPNRSTDRDVKQRNGGSAGSETMTIELVKDAAGLGFSIEGGKDSPQGDRPLLIKRIFKGGAADKEGQLEEGDEIMSINNQPVTNMTRTEAWNFLKKLPEGPVILKVRKASVTM